MNRTDYHSAHYDYHPAEPVKQTLLPNGWAFVNDITEGLPEDFDQCDVLYAEPSWRFGYPKFNERAGKPIDRPYKSFVESVLNITTLGKPTVLVWGRHVSRHLPKNVVRTSVRSNEHEAIAFQFNGARISDECETLNDVLVDLAGQYSCIGDPLCGYGNSGRVFTKFGKRFIMSDMNPHCIGYISEHYDEWENVV